MGNMKNSPVLAALVSAATVAAHGHVTQIVVNGVAYQGYDPTSFPYMTDPPTVVGWTADDTDNGFVAPDAYGTGDIICHKSATPAGGHATVAAGDMIALQWDTWPDSHHGPVIDYLASCSGSCESVDKTALEFFKIDGAAIADASVSQPGNWATDVLIADNFTWVVQIPESIAPGNYVLRHEIIALHSAGQADGAQNYPQCFNLAVTGSGSQSPAGTLGTALYNEDDPGILFNIYSDPIDYTMPGPALISGVSSSVAQSTVEATATSSATVGSGGSAATTTAATSAAETTTSAAEPTTSTTAAATTTTSAAGGGVATTTQVTTTFQTTTIGGGATTTATGAVAAQTLYGQCGGNNYSGATECSEGTCTSYNEWYSQCVPASS